MNNSTFETYKPQPNEFAVAKFRKGNNFKPYVPTPHPFVQRLEEFRAIQSLWTPGTYPTGK